MVIDSSAVIAIVNLEPEAMDFVEAIRLDPVRLMSVANRFEVFIAASRHPNPKVLPRSDDLIRELRISLEPVLESQLDLTRRCWERFGKGRHPAALNFGDCFAYALSGTSGEPLLFKGNDFAQTDVKKALDV